MPAVLESFKQVSSIPHTFMDRAQTALVEVGGMLKASGYRFVTPTPETHRLVNARPGRDIGRSLRDIFGWSRVFRPGDLPDVFAERLEEAGALETTESGLRSAVRFSSLGDLLLVHSAFPTQASDAVFFGPDTYRFARAIAGAVRRDEFPAPETIVDIGTGSGAGALVAGRLLPGARLILTDVNRAALRFAEVNAALNGFASVEIRQSDVLAEVPEQPGLILSNPPYLVDAAERVYRHGGGRWGFDLSLRIADEAVTRLAPGGRLVLYTGTPVIDGVDVFLQALQPLLERRRVTYSYEEIDPDVFAEELLRPPYDNADRIAAVLLIADAPQRGN